MPAKKTTKKQTEAKKKKQTSPAAEESREVLVEVKKPAEEAPEIKEKKESVKSQDEQMQKEIEKAVKAGDRSKFIETVGRRKTSTARVRLFTQGEKGITVNKNPHKDYFRVTDLQKIVEDPMEKLKCLGKFGVIALVKGGGPTGQAEAVRHGIARALVVLNPYFKKRLKKYGFLTRDPRMRERKKPGLKRARRAPQWSKR